MDVLLSENYYNGIINCRIGKAPKVFLEQYYNKQMMSDLHIENYDFTIIDFNELLIDNIQHQIINSLHEFNLLEKSMSYCSKLARREIMF